MTAIQLELTAVYFDGDDYEADRDCDRLTGQMLRVYQCMSNHRWWAMEDLAKAAGCPATSASAQTRNLRKERFGAHDVERRYVGDGLYLYRLNAKEVD